ncbi:hypothetical protein M0811_00846 [Anaeramoeba ignava]|uniref:CS domain-containing protein n=1 Tax=Anaeramoeba ignava TaxID=1746090 RepID=A0A9Q0RBK8_ANAIG|nr:hypothetical protein M0811_00846 [Anaeramoeba ignava]
MIIPKFNVEQEDNFIIINIKIPYSKFDDIDYYILGKEFKFYSKPYFLRLTFPHELDDENERDVKFNYNIEQNEISFKIPKKIKGEFFENLEMLTSILTPSKIKDKTIEVLDSKKNYEDDNDDNDDQFFNEAIEEIYENLPRVGHEIQNREDNLNEIEKGIENLNLNQNQNQNQNQKSKSKSNRFPQKPILLWF